MINVLFILVTNVNRGESRVYSFKFLFLHSEGAMSHTGFIFFLKKQALFMLSSAVFVTLLQN